MEEEGMIMVMVMAAKVQRGNGGGPSGRVPSLQQVSTGCP